ncbi:hypothetical protein Q8A67_001230 [Cirrhinus molitorella]|uniref:NAD(P)(+)--arginine ADP-ribosyltransferase n=1 Tax=Cirrhinus molitorella TaxID=172907 RepID=A0AA88U7F1_9TELE|nr:hypothetical protein Q8A67_001230 [Cirrhinus molitorella]
MQLTVEALLLILAALGQDHRAAEVPLDMALDSVDDQYDGCRENMANRVETTFLKKELKNSEFSHAWNAGADVTKYSKLPHEKEVLIPPYEKFKVTDIKTRTNQSDLCHPRIENTESDKDRDNNILSI